MRPLTSLILCCMLFGSAAAVQGQSAAKKNKQAKIKSAAGAAYNAITDNATIKDWDGTILRRGSNEWTCYPDMPDLPEQNPMCLDEQWIKWMEAYLNQEEPNITGVGIGYMLQGGSPASNSRPICRRSDRRQPVDG